MATWLPNLKELGFGYTQRDAHNFEYDLHTIDSVKLLKAILNLPRLESLTLKRLDISLPIINAVEDRRWTTRISPLPSLKKLDLDDCDLHWAELVRYAANLKNFRLTERLRNYNWREFWGFFPRDTLRFMFLNRADLESLADAFAEIANDGTGLGSQLRAIRINTVSNGDCHSTLKIINGLVKLFSALPTLIDAALVVSICTDQCHDLRNDVEATNAARGYFSVMSSSSLKSLRLTVFGCDIHRRTWRKCWGTVLASLSVIVRNFPSLGTLSLELPVTRRLAGDRSRTSFFVAPGLYYPAGQYAGSPFRDPDAVPTDLSPNFNEADLLELQDVFDVALNSLPAGSLTSFRIILTVPSFRNSMVEWLRASDGKWFITIDGEEDCDVRDPFTQEWL